MMFAWATLQTPGRLPSAPVMKQFQQGQGWAIACSRGGQYRDENPGKNQATSLQRGLNLLQCFMQTFWDWKKQFVRIGDESFPNRGLRCSPY